jgi:hypothetical protein
MVVVVATAGVAGAPIAATTASFFGLSGGSAATAGAATAAGTAAASAGTAAATTAATGGATALATGAVGSAVAAGELTAAGAAGSYAAIGATAVLNPAALILGTALLGAAASGSSASYDAVLEHIDEKVVKDSQMAGEAAQARFAQRETVQELVEAGAISADCWKPLLHDSSETPSRGMTMSDVMEHPCIRSVDVLGACPIITNIWGEPFRLDVVQLPVLGRNLAYHVSAMEKTPL